MKRSARTTAVALSLAAAVTAGAATIALAGSGGTDAAPAVTPTATPATPTQPADPVVAPTPDRVDALPGFGFVRAVDGDARSVTFDAADMLSGDEALAAARDAGVDVSDGLPNDYFIRNDAIDEHTYDLADDVRITVLVNGVEEKVLTVDEWAALVAEQAKGHEGTLYSPYNFTFSGDDIVEVQQQYLP